MGNVEHDIYGEHLKKHAEDVREWGDATPERVRVRCLAAEAQVELLQEHLKGAVDDLAKIGHAFLAYEHAPPADQGEYRAELLAVVREVVNRHAGGQ